MSPLGRLSVFGPWLIALALFAALILTGTVGAVTSDVMDPSTLAFLVATGSWGLVQATVGVLIAVRRPENRVGRLLQISGPLVISVFLGYAIEATTVPGAGDAVIGLAGWWSSMTIYLAIFLAFPMVGILYPDGRLPGPRWRLPIAVVLLAELALAAMYGVKAGPLDPGLPDNPFGFVDVPPHVREAVTVIGTLGLVLAMGLAVAAVVTRWRRADRVERSQLKWLLATLSLAGVLFPLTFGASSPDDPPNLAAVLSVASALLIPVAIGIAVLRYRLYEIDRLISRTVSWAVLTGVLVVVFGGLVVALQAVLAGLTQGQTLAVAGSTLVAAALFQPVRRRVQAIVDRRFDRARYDAQRTVDAFAGRLRDEVDLSRLQAALISTTDDAVRPISATVWLRPGRVSRR